MKRKVLLLALLFTFCSVLTVHAEDRKLQFSIKDAMANQKVKDVLLDIPVYWGSQKHPAVVKKFGTFKTTKRANAFLKSKESACQWALASAIIALQERAEREGGNAVIAVKSNIKNKEFSSPDKFECLAGGMMVNVALKGTVVTIKK